MKSRGAESYLQSRYHPLLAFGRVALFFTCSSVGIQLAWIVFKAGSGLVAMYGFWLLGLMILYPFYHMYNRFKRFTPLTSLWRFF